MLINKFTYPNIFKVASFMIIDFYVAGMKESPEEPSRDE